MLVGETTGPADCVPVAPWVAFFAGLAAALEVAAALEAVARAGGADGVATTPAGTRTDVTGAAVAEAERPEARPAWVVVAGPDQPSVVYRDAVAALVGAKASR